MEVLVGFESTLVLSRFSRKAKMLRLNVDPPGSTLLLMLFVEQCLRMELQILKFWLFLMLFCDNRKISLKYNKKVTTMYNTITLHLGIDHVNCG